MLDEAPTSPHDEYPIDLKQGRCGADFAGLVKEISLARITGFAKRTAQTSKCIGYR